MARRRITILVRLGAVGFALEGWLVDADANHVQHVVIDMTPEALMALLRRLQN